MENILQNIISNKRIEIERYKKSISESDMFYDINDNSYTKFQDKIIEDIKNNNISIIAEIKKSSPSKGILRNNIDHNKIAEIYQQNNVSAISVVTDEKFFNGNIKMIQDIRELVDVAILRKDFIIDKYQITQSRYIGANAILLIASILSEEELIEFENYANMLNLDIIVEVNNESELAKITNLKTRLIGVNNRNLSNFTIDKNNVINLYSQIKSYKEDAIVICESGISSREDIQFYQKNNINSFLIGTYFMQDNIIDDNEFLDNIKLKLTSLLGNNQ